MSPPREKDPGAKGSAGARSSSRDSNEAPNVPDGGALVQALAAALAEPIARRVVDLLRSGDEIDLVDQHTSPLGPRRHVRLCREGKLPHVRIGRRWCVKRADLDHYMHGDQPEAQPEDAADEELARELGLRLVK